MSDLGSRKLARGQRLKPRSSQSIKNKGQKNHKSMATLLSVLHYHDLLETRMTNIPRCRQACARKLSAQVMEEEESLMEALANAAKGDIPDDGAIEVDSDKEYCG
ncbi:hypothetical protein B0H10DRAFT_1959059 [Mycena sp. CBHHK59/15]|nr:hypothetical protein B0H10DRAFT_1959059 [Mycena sp. CBHHK59/15]